MPLPAFAIPLIAAAAPVVLDQLFGGPSGAEQAQQRNASAVSQAEADRIRKQLELFERLQEISGSPSAMQGILEATGGKGFQLPRNLSDARAGSGQLGDILGQIDFSQMNERDLLLALATGIPTGTPATLQGSSQAFNQQQLREQGFGDVAGLISALLASKSRSAAPTVAAPGIPVTGGAPGSTGLPLGFGVFS